MLYAPTVVEYPPAHSYSLNDVEQAVVAVARRCLSEAGETADISRSHSNSKHGNLCVFVSHLAVLVGPCYYYCLQRSAPVWQEHADELFSEVSSIAQSLTRVWLYAVFRFNLRYVRLDLVAYAGVTIQTASPIIVLFIDVGGGKLHDRPSIKTVTKRDQLMRRTGVQKATDQSSHARTTKLVEAEKCGLERHNPVMCTGRMFVVIWRVRWLPAAFGLVARRSIVKCRQGA